MPDRLDRLLTLLDIETLDANLFRGQSRDDGFKQLYGGQVVAQALVAATRTVPKDRPAQSLHAYFLRPGDLHLPIIYEVERIRDGGSFTTRRVQAIQNSVPIFSMMVSFHAPEDGWDHQPAMPEVPAPEVLKSGTLLFAEWQAGPPDVSPGLLGVKVIAERAGIEIRPALDLQSKAGETPGGQRLWIRCTGDRPPPPEWHTVLLAYASDFDLIGTAKLPHGGYYGQPDMMMASLDHAIWFHRPANFDDWLLYCIDAPTAAAGRAFITGRLYDRAGRLVASTTQEGLMRRLRDRS
ncbi:MAG: acyl-CoA thioesterase II [Gammaproteobacteria bacterium]|nr:acyl-CoA thioesterase II [Gammaproteobacteria bacterium]